MIAQDMDERLQALQREDVGHAATGCRENARQDSGTAAAESSVLQTTQA